MISWFVSSSPTLGSTLWQCEACLGFSLSLSLCPSCDRCLSKQINLQQIFLNKKINKNEKHGKIKCFISQVAQCLPSHCATFHLEWVSSLCLGKLSKLGSTFYILFFEHSMWGNTAESSFNMNFFASLNSSGHLHLFQSQSLSSFMLLRLPSMISYSCIFRVPQMAVVLTFPWWAISY